MNGPFHCNAVERCSSAIGKWRRRQGWRDHADEFCAHADEVSDSRHCAYIGVSAAGESGATGSELAGEELRTAV